MKGKTAALMITTLLLIPAPALACKKKDFKKEQPKISQAGEKKAESKFDEKIATDKWNGYQCMILEGRIRLYNKDSGFLKDYDVHGVSLDDAVGLSCDGDAIITVTKKEISIFYGIDKLTDVKELDRKDLWRKCHIDIKELDAFAEIATEDMLVVIGRKGILFMSKKDIGEQLSETSAPSKCGEIPSKKFSLLLPKDLQPEDIVTGTFGNIILITYKGSKAVYKFKLSDDGKKMKNGKPVK